MNSFKKYSFLLMTLVFGLSSCMKDNEVTLEQSFVEFDAATWNANAAGLTYPILTKVPLYGQIVNNADPNITRASGTIKFRVNLVGRQRSTPTEVTYTVSTTGPTATSTNALAASGTHFTTTGKVIIPANSSFGEVEVVIVNPGASSTVARDVVLVLSGTADLPASENEKAICIRISQS